MTNLCIKEALRFESNIKDEHDAQRDRELLLQYTLNVSRAYLYTHPESPLSSTQTTTFQHAMMQRQQGMPIAYITGQRAFWSLELDVTPDTLIPRPETEQLVEIALSALDATAPISLLDLGTGSGAIALALATERPEWHITACDRSENALTVATQNAKRLGLLNINFVLSDWLQSFSQQRFDAIISNPPYLSAEDPHLQQGDLRFEPPSALISGQSGLEALHTIIQNTYNSLNDHGILLLEHGCKQGAAVHDLLHHYGYHDIQCWQDGQGHDRVTGGKKILQDCEKSAIMDPNLLGANNFNKSE
ncbi:MAG: peptide chain release factor N(5)-glutamine methyltransferase [Gammaproteobacteria bacterium]|nr:peptide chain release factor N(5)-glutamine methyltransferase [Gammaproteobacteria bacterium]